MYLDFDVDEWIYSNEIMVQYNIMKCNAMQFLFFRFVRVRLGLFRIRFDRHPRASKPRGPTVRRIQILDLFQSGIRDFFENQLGDPVSLLDLKDVCGIQVEQDHAERPPVVGVNDAGPAVDPLLDGESRPGGDPGVGSGGTGNRQIGVDDATAARGDGRRPRCRQIEPGRQDRPLFGKGRVFRELLDLEERFHIVTITVTVTVVDVVDVVVGSGGRKEQYRRRGRREDALVVSVATDGRNKGEERKEPNLVRKE